MMTARMGVARKNLGALGFWEFSIDFGRFYAFLDFCHRNGFIWGFEPGNPS